MKRHLTSLVIRETQIKAMKQHYLITERLHQSTGNSKLVFKDAEEVKFVSATCWNAKLCRHFRKQSGTFLKAKKPFTICPTNSPPLYLPKNCENMCQHKGLYREGYQQFYSS